MKKPELLSPAGSIKAMRHAFAYGADAVYAGLPKYSLRARNNDFKKTVLQAGIEEAHAQNKKLYVTANLFPHNPKVKSFLKDIEPVIDMKPDALIMADPGLIMMVREKWPEMPIHLSVQMNTVNYAAVKFWQKMRVERIILSRELSLDEVEGIRQECPDMELEVFVHGALCMAYSGRCLLSGYFNHRDSNQGVCTNSCRWNYKTIPAEESVDSDYIVKENKNTILPLEAFDESKSPIAEEGLKRHPAADEVYFLEEANRPGEMIPILEDEHGTYIMNSKDLRALEHVERLVKIGIDCLKIEGRTKSPYYVARTAQVYRKSIDDAVEGREFNPKLLGELENLSNRGYTDGFYQRHSSEEYQNYLTGYSRSHSQKFVGELQEIEDNKEWMVIKVRNKFQIGDRLEYLLPSGKNIEVILDKMTDESGNNNIEVAPGDPYIVRIPTYGVEAKTLLICRFL